ncbi:MAG: hypothetical protein AAF533_13180 [Acidobacteriota bacterium]
MLSRRSWLSLVFLSLWSVTASGHDCADSIGGVPGNGDLGEQMSGPPGTPEFTQIIKDPLNGRIWRQDDHLHDVEATVTAEAYWAGLQPNKWYRACYEVMTDSSVPDGDPAVGSRLSLEILGGCDVVSVTQGSTLPYGAYASCEVQADEAGKVHGELIATGQGGYLNHPYVSFVRFLPISGPGGVPEPEPVPGAPPNGCSCTDSDVFGDDPERSPNPTDPCDRREAPQASATHGNNTILLHSGQEDRQETDLFIRGIEAPLDIRINRRHLTGDDRDDSPFGPAWAFNYQQALEDAPGSTAGAVLHHHGFGRRGVFYQTDPDMFVGQGGRSEVIRYEAIDANTGTFFMRRADGFELVFFAEILEDGRRHGLLTEARTAADNYISFTYDSAPIPQERRLISIDDSYGRAITLHYENPDFPELITRIVDFGGRDVRYTYNSDRQLTQVQLPEVVTPPEQPDLTGVDRPTLRYTYFDGELTQLRNALTSITYPNQLQSDAPAGSFGVPRLQWTYYTEPDPPGTGTDILAGMVATHAVGNDGSAPFENLPENLRAGGTFSYDCWGFADGKVTTDITDRNGRHQRHVWARSGQLLEEHLRGDDGSPTTHRLNAFDDDGNLLYHNSFGIVQTQSHLASASHHVGQLPQTLTVSRDGIDLVTTIVREPVFGHPFRVTSPRGNEPGANAADFTTTYFLDYMEDPEAAVIHFAPLLGLSQTTLRDQMIAAGIPVTEGATDRNGDGRTDQQAGRLLGITRPASGSHPSGATEDTHELLVYNDFGQLIRRVDREHNVTELSYHPANDPDGDGIVDSARVGSEGGFLASITVDSTSDSRRNNSTNPFPVIAKTELFYQAHDGAPSNPYGNPTRVVDADGIEQAFWNDSLQRARRTRLRSALTPSQVQESQYTYDANGNLTRIWVPNSGVAFGPDGTHDHQPLLVEHEYDILDQLRKTTDSAERFYEYDPTGNLREQSVLDFGHLYGKPTQTWSNFDGLGRPGLHVVAAPNGFMPPAEWETHRTYEWSSDQVVIRHSKPGRAATSETVLEFDIHGSVKTSTRQDGRPGWPTWIDPVQEWVRDANGNVTTSLVRDGLSIIRQADFTYDNWDRLTSRADSVLSSAPDGDVFDGVSDGRISQSWQYLDTGLVDSWSGPNGEQETYEHDGRGLRIRGQDAQGNLALIKYTPSGLLDRITRYHPAVFPAPARNFITDYVHDPLGQVSQIIEPNGQTTTLERDLRGRVFRRTDHLGNQTEYWRKEQGEWLYTHQYLSADGTHASRWNRDSNQGGGDGVITKVLWRNDAVSINWDDDENTTAAWLDHHGRPYRVRYPEGDEVWLPTEHDAEGRITKRRLRGGTTLTYARDDKHREVTVSNSMGHPDVYLHHAPLGIPDIIRTLEGSTVLTEVKRELDGLGRVRSEYSYLKSLAPEGRESRFDFEGLNLLTRTTYPSGDRAIRRQYGNTAQLESIWDSLTSPEQLIASYTNQGPRTVDVLFGNGTSTDPAGGGVVSDSNDRLRELRWKASDGTVLAHYLQFYDGTNAVTQQAALQLGRQHDFTLDSVNRVVTLSSTVPEANATVSWSGLDKMLSFIENGIDRMPEAEVTQYTELESLDRDYHPDASLESDGAHHFEVDHHGRPVRIEDLAGNPVAELTYDGLGRIAHSVEHGATVAETRHTRFYYQGWQVLEEWDWNLESTAGRGLRHQHVTGRSIDDHVQIRLAGHSGTSGLDEDYYYHLDPLGSVGAISDAGGSLVELYDYSLFGRSRILSPSLVERTESAIGNPYTFQGRRLLRTGAAGQLDLLYFRNRFFDPSAGEFIKVDPLGVWAHGQGNGYSAFAGHPWLYKDPYGTNPLAQFWTFLGIHRLGSGIADHFLEEWAVSLFGPEVRDTSLHDIDKREFRESMRIQPGDDPRMEIARRTGNDAAARAIAEQHAAFDSVGAAASECMDMSSDAGLIAAGLVTPASGTALYVYTTPASELRSDVLALNLAGDVADVAGIGGSLGVVTDGSRAARSTRRVCCDRDGGGEPDLYRITEGVRRAYARHLRGEESAVVKVFDADSGLLIETIEVPIDSLRSPKSVIEMDDTPAIDRWFKIWRGLEDGDDIPPIEVNPGHHGVPIRDIEFGHSSGAP